ncbi:M48 family metallopeptidase [Baekduia alba]|uniref:M48 family metallopeptidase n=1 Tax=Baekduia alba TaxID=2997333 RepID=UPI0023410C6D|nr:SprT family zinc-dependent metalloprotease [Baekduia alba]
MAAPPAAETLTVDLGERVVEVEVRRSDRARTTRIQLGRDVPLRIIVPAGASDEYAAQALRNKAAWVLSKLSSVEEERHRLAELGLATDTQVWLHGARVTVESTSRIAHARLQDGRLLVPAEDASRAVQRWYRRTARTWLRQLVAAEAERLGVEVSGVGVRDQRTRWGSCSRHGHISLNWRLVVMPEHVARYVVVHELVHLRVANHSKSFWRALSAALPDWQEASDWLGRHGNELRNYQPGAELS